MFLKTKKGFTLVELMIVVVIMAILVAVAVPIYTAVTANAKKNTCAANRKMIVQQINTMVMNYQNSSYNKDAEFTITTNPETEKADVISSDNIYTKDVIEGLFHVVPCCPVSGNIITVTFVRRGGADVAEPINPSITVSCSEHGV